jgi:hypothetical protein
MQPPKLRPSGTRHDRGVNMLSGARRGMLGLDDQKIWAAAGYGIETEVILIANGKMPTYGVRSIY